MPTYTWQSNDALSTYNDSTGSVKSGVKNLVPATSGSWDQNFAFLRDLMRGLREPGIPLTPYEALKSALNLSPLVYYSPVTDVMVTTKPIQMTNVIEINKTVLDRLKRDPEVLKAAVKAFGGFAPPDFETFRKNAISFFPRARMSAASFLQLLQSKVDAYTAQIEARIQAALSRVPDYFEGGARSAQSEQLRTRVLGSSSATTVPQLQFVNSFNNPGGGSEANVFSRSVRDPGLSAKSIDLLYAVNSTIFVKSGKVNSALLGLPNMQSTTGRRVVSDLMQQADVARLAGFYPSVYTAELPSTYANSARELAILGGRRALLYLARVAVKNRIHLLGSGQLLNEIFRSASAGLKLAIAHGLDPYNFDLRGQTRRGYTFDVGSVRCTADGEGFVRTMFLIDLLHSKPNYGFLKSTLEYLRWVKGRCLAAAAAGRTSLSSIAPVQTSQVAIDASKLRIPMSIDLTRLSQESPSVDFSILEPSMFTPQADPVIVDIEDVEEPLAEVGVGTLPTDIVEFEQTSEDGKPDEDKGLDPKYIYAASAVAVIAAIGVVAYTKKRSKSQI